MAVIENAPSMRTEIPRSEVLDFIASLGVDPQVVRNEVCSVSIEPDAVSVTTFALNDQGHRFIVDDEVATVVTTIAITDGA